MVKLWLRIRDRGIQWILPLVKLAQEDPHVWNRRAAATGVLVWVTAALLLVDPAPAGP